LSSKTHQKHASGVIDLGKPSIHLGNDVIDLGKASIHFGETVLNFGKSSGTRY